MSHFKGPDIELALPNFRPNTSVLKLLADFLFNNGQDTALVESDTGKSATHREMFETSTSLTTGLRDFGVSAGDLVVMCCEKSILAYSTVLGIMFTGATAVVIQTVHADRIHELTEGHHVKVVFCDPVYVESVSESVRRMTKPPNLIVTVNTDDQGMQSLMKPTKDFCVYEVKDVNKHVAMVLFTCGTTDDPKGIEMTDVALQLSGFPNIRLYKTGLGTSPFYWYCGFLAFISSIFNNYTIILCNSREAKDILGVMEKYQIDMWLMNTGLMTWFNNEPTLHLFDISSVKQVFVVGEVLLPCVLETFMTKVFGGRAKLNIGYGSTEAGSITNCDYLRDVFLVGMSGKLSPGAEVKILDDSGNVVPIGCMGQLWIKSVGITTGYWNRPDLNHQLFDEEGFFQSGDLGFFDKDGNLYSRGRISDCINFRGSKFSPAETENILMSHPAVLDASIVGKPHPVDIEHPTAYVVKKPGSNVTEKEIAAFVDEQVDDHRKLKGGVHYVDMLPRVFVGKIRRKLLR